jgi:KDO2-lipid IV(A) lauroyltransferase
MSKRFTFDNIEILDEYYEKGKNIILYLGHYGNWEWLTFARRASKLKHKNEQECISVYHKLENKTFDKFYLRLRKKSNSILVPQEGLLRKLISFNKTGILGMYCFIADQGTL